MAIGDKRGTVVVGAASTEYTLANEIKSDYNTHIASTTYHVAADSTNTVGSADSTTLATVLTLANEIKADFNAHLILSGVHRTNDVHNRVQTADAQDAASVYLLLNDIKARYNDHVANTHVHKAADTSNTVSSADTNNSAPNIDFNADGGAVLVELTGASSWDGTVDFQSTPDGSTFYNIPYVSRNTITPAFSVTQISSPSTAAIYLLLGPLSQVRIAVGVGSTGTLTIVWRTISDAQYLTMTKLLANSGIDIGDVDVLSGTAEVISVVHHPFGKGALTINGIQYSAELTTSTDVYEVVESATITQPTGYTLTEIEFGLTGRNKSSSTAETVVFKWEASDAGSSWTDLFAEQTHAASAVAYEEETWSGRFAPTGNFLGTSASFQVRYVIKSGSAGGETALGSTKSSSFIIAHYRRT